MSDFTLYFSLGWKHIISPDALDHILFIAAMAAIYQVKDWKNVLILVTAFTIGHSLTLALSVFEIVKINSKLVEILIPVTILISALYNMFQLKTTQRSVKANYFFALFFGLIHGLGFANTLRFLLAENENLAVPLLSFNIGLEAGQIVIVCVILGLSYLCIHILKIPQKWWILLLSSLAVLVSLKMIFERL